MGCVPDKNKKETKDNHQFTQATQNLHTISGTPFLATHEKSVSGQKQAVKAYQKGKAQSFSDSRAGGSTDGVVNGGLEQLVKKYRITAKQSMYKTNSIHSYPYRKLLTFNPSQDMAYSIEKQILDKSYNLNLSRDYAAKFRLSKK